VKKQQKIVVIILVVFFGLGIIKNPLVKTIVTNTGSFVMGAKLSINSFAVGVFKQAVRIKGLKVHNPKGFPKGVLIDIPEIGVEYNLPAVFKGKIHLPLIVLDLKEMIVVKNKDGQLNVDALKVSQQAQKPKKKGIVKKDKKATKKMAIQIDEARLNLGKVVVKDYSKGDLPIIFAYDIGVKDKVYKDIKSAEQFALLVMLEAMGPAGLKGAAIYGAATVLGVAFLPAGVVGVLVGKDSSISEFKSSREQAYKKVIGLIKDIGSITKEDKNAYLIEAKVYGGDVTIKIDEKNKRNSEIKIKARRLMLPKPEIAGGIMYQISKILK